MNYTTWSSSWSNVSKKPKGFRCVGKNIYEYPVGILYDDFEKGNTITVGFEILPIKYYVDKELNLKEIDLIETEKIIKSKLNIDIGLDEYYNGLSMFKRDGCMFPFLDHIRLNKYQKKKYLQYKILRDRIGKIKQIKNKM